MNIIHILFFDFLYYWIYVINLLQCQVTQCICITFDVFVSSNWVTTEFIDF